MRAAPIPILKGITMKNEIEELVKVKKIFYLIWFKSISDIKDEVSRKYLGILWWFIEPILYMIAIYIVLVSIQGRSGKNIVQFLLIGMVSWRWFEISISQGSNSIITNSNLIKQIYVPKYIFPCITAITNLIKFSFVFVCLLVFLIFSVGPPSVKWLSLPLIIASQFLMQLAISSLLSIAVPFVPDLKSVVDNTMILVFFLSGIMYNISHVPESLRHYLFLNPMIAIINSYRIILLDHSWPLLNNIFILDLLSFLGIIFAGMLFRRLDRIIPKIMLQ